MIIRKFIDSKTLFKYSLIIIVLFIISGCCSSTNYFSRNKQDITRENVPIQQTIQINKIENKMRYSHPNQFGDWLFFDVPATEVVREIVEAKLGNYGFEIGESKYSLYIEIINLVYDLRGTILKFRVHSQNKILLEETYSVGNGWIYNCDFRGQIKEIESCAELFVVELAEETQQDETSPN